MFRMVIIILSRQTVSRRLAEHDLHARTPAVKPLVSSKNKIIVHATHHVTWSEEKWQTVHFSDESKFNLYRSDGRKYVRRGVGRSTKMY